MKTLLVFGQALENCAPCRQYEPVLLKLQSEYNVEVEKVIAFTPEGEANERNKEYGILGTPTTIVLEDGVEVNRLMGAKPLSFMLKELGI